jgi:hypothetical protein
VNEVNINYTLDSYLDFTRDDIFLECLKFGDLILTELDLLKLPDIVSGAGNVFKCV